jgi:hypothetical protein
MSIWKYYNEILLVQLIYANKKEKKLITSSQVFCYSHIKWTKTIALGHWLKDERIFTRVSIKTPSPVPD